ncbi:MAG: hypothetical protein M3Y53_11330 [Thermoproteota archaeon]|nr:hypothetical protein [Thermoproteota archaeon]
MATEKNKEDFLTKEIESWKGFEYALREENRILFHEMLNECRKYGDATIAKGDNYSTESLFMTLILQQQKMINQLIANASNNDH